MKDKLGMRDIGAKKKRGVKGVLGKYA